MYNGQYKTLIDVRIIGKTHNECLEMSKYFKKQCDAWICTGLHYSEHKSARKGVVLTRDLMIYQTDYSHGIIIFREAIQRLASTFHQKVFVNVRSTAPTNTTI